MRGLYERHGAMVYRRALAILRSPPDAEDAAQEVFVRAARGLDAFAGRSSAVTWLYQITTNLCLNRLRDGRRRAALAQERVLPAAEVAVGPATSPEHIALRRVLAEAPPEQAAAAVYVHVDGLSHDEAAAILGVSRRTVGNLVERFGRLARAVLAGEEAP
ncbi:MAG: RNA polymerase sigma factor [Myxococcales bacterium]|nr:RNA polymerase sigma factor [Myxococcales bacterium]MCB9732054.1 RNA polymerase sigma factor [Deltaproteobacteria bacterium]